MKMRGSLDRTKRIADSIFFFFPKVLIVRVMGRARNNFIGRARVYKLLVSGETSPYGLKVLIAQMKKGTFFSSLGRGDGDQRSRRPEVDTSVVFRCNCFVTRVEDPRASRTSLPASHPAVVYRVVPYDFSVMTTSVDDLHFFQTKSQLADNVIFGRKGCVVRVQLYMHCISAYHPFVVYTYT